MHRLRQWEYWGSDYMWSRDFYVKMSDVWRLSVGELNETSRSLELLWTSSPSVNLPQFNFTCAASIREAAEDMYGWIKHSLPNSLDMPHFRTKSPIIIPRIATSSFFRLGQAAKSLSRDWGRTCSKILSGSCWIFNRNVGPENKLGESTEKIMYLVID